MTLTPYRDFPPWQAVFVFVVDERGAGLRLMEEQAAKKSMNEEQTASLKTALLH